MPLPTNRKSHMAFQLAYLHLTFALVMVKVKVMHILTVNISQTMTDNISQAMTDETNITMLTNGMSHTTFRLAYLHLTFAHCLGQGLDHAHFDCEFLAKDDMVE